MSVIDVKREKLLDAVEFFARNTNFFGLVKMFKLVYFLDMLHFRETGRTVTGLDYAAWQWGPVATDLWVESHNPRKDLAETVQIVRPPTTLPGDDAPKSATITPIANRKRLYMTAREKRIADELAEIFRDVKADLISEISHAKNGPWDRAWRKGSGTAIDRFDSINLKMGTGRGVPIEELRERASEYA